jgi:hypothetical protein
MAIQVGESASEAAIMRYAPIAMMATGGMAA